MAAAFKEGDRVRVQTRPVTEEDRKNNLYFEHMAGLIGTVQNVYENDLVAIKVEPDTAPKVSVEVHQRAVERMRKKFFDSVGEEAKKGLTKEELEFQANFMQLVQAKDLVLAS
jgi:preprotein translocase subunit YajC